MGLNKVQKVHSKIVKDLLSCEITKMFVTKNITSKKQKSNIKLKIILADLGKNETVKRNFKHKFGTNYKLSVGIDVLTKDIEFGDGLDGTLLIWNVSGDKIFDIIKQLNHKEDEIVLIVFDLTKIKSFEQMNNYLSKIRQFNFDEYPYVLIGNKSDFLKKGDLFIYSKIVKEFAKKEGCIYLETSSEINSDLDKAFNQLARKILNYKVTV